MADELQIRLLGELELSVSGEPLALPSSKKTRALLGYLVLTRKQHTRSRLCDLLWDGPADPRAALRWSLTKLRPLVDSTEPRILADRERVGFDSAAVAVDLFELRGRLGAGLAALDLDELEALVGAFRGELLEGLELDDCFGFAHWLAGEREKARNLHAQLLAGLVARLAEQPERGLEHARAWVALEPLDEAAHASQVELLMQLGRAPEAQRAAAACDALLRRELGRPAGEAVRAALDLAVEPSVLATPRPPTSGGGPARPARDLGLFGRADECAELERFLGTNQGSAPARVLWLSGEAGIGKSRLLAELLERARQRGATSHYGKAYEAEASRPLAIWSAALGGDADFADPAGRTTLFEEVRARLLAGADGLVVVALDDLQWIDEVSAALVSWLAREGGPRLLLAVAVRPGELEDNPAAARLARSLAREQLLERIELEPLAEPEALALMRSIDPAIDAGRALELVGGNPLFAIELARTGEAERSPRLAACITDRLQRLGEVEHELLRVGAAFGRRFSLELVAEVTGLRLGELLGAAESLELAGLLRPEGLDEVDFAHDLIRRAAHAEQSDPARRLLHRRIARALAGDPRSADELAPVLARQASLADEHELAVESSVRAGERCLRLFAPEEALSFVRRGLEHTPRLSAADERSWSVELYGIEVHAGLGRRNLGVLHERLSQLAEACAKNAEHAAARTALYLLSVLDEQSGAFERAEARTLEAVAEGRVAGAASEARALANSGRCLAQLERQLPRAELLLGEAEASAAAGGGAPSGASAPRGSAAVDLAWGRGLLAWHAGRLDEAERELERAWALAVDRGNHWAAFECLSRLALVDLAAQRPARVLEREPELRLGAQRLDGGSEAALVEALIELARDTSLGTRESAAALERALEVLREKDSKAVLAAVLNQVAETALGRGERERARAWAGEALAAAGAVGRERQVARARAILDTTGGSEPTEPEES